MKKNISKLDHSIEKAKDWANRILLEDDTVTTTVLIRGDQNVVQMSCEFPDDGRNHSAAKHEFAQRVRCHAVAEQATEVILITEAWAATPTWSGRPSLCPQRTEVLVVTVETNRHVTTAAWELKRDVAGRFLELGSELSRGTRKRGPAALEGTLSGLLPGKEVMDDPNVRVFADRYLSDPEFRQHIRPGAH